MNRDSERERVGGREMEKNELLIEFFNGVSDRV